jgi:addiction module HigA family antidote
MNRLTNQEGVTFTGRLQQTVHGYSQVAYDDGSIVKKLKPVTPGELLREEFLVPMAISQYRLAKEIAVPAQRIGEIVGGKGAITADSDLRLCRFFGLSNGYWLRAQAAYDTEVAEEALAETLIRSSRGRAQQRSRVLSADQRSGLLQRRPGNLRKSSSFE